MSDDVLITNVDEQTIAHMVLFGHARRGSDGVYELTDAGNKWLQEWCAKKIAEHQEERP